MTHCNSGADAATAQALRTEVDDTVLTALEAGGVSDEEAVTALAQVLGGLIAGEADPVARVHLLAAAAREIDAAYDAAGWA